MFHEAASVTVSSQDLENPALCCPFCYGAESVGTGTFAQTNPAVEYLKCGNCYAYYSDRTPTSKYLHNFYHHAIYEGTISKSDALAKRLARSILRGPIRKELAGSISPLRVMDFGGGSGSLGLALRQALGRSDTQVTLIDLYKPRDSLGLNFLTPEQLRSSGEHDFDLVVLSAVIEHLAQPGAIAADLYKRVRRGGFIYFRAPSLFPLGKLRPNLLRWPEHLSDLPPRFWHELPRSLGWKVEIVKSRPSQTSDRLQDNLLAALLANFMKLPGHLEAFISGLTNRRYQPKYQCAGGWDVIYQKQE